MHRLVVVRWCCLLVYLLIGSTHWQGGTSAHWSFVGKVFRLPFLLDPIIPAFRKPRDRRLNVWTNRNRHVTEKRSRTGKKIGTMKAKTFDCNGVLPSPLMRSLVLYWCV